MHTISNVHPSNVLSQVVNLGLSPNLFSVTVPDPNINATMTKGNNIHHPL